MHIKRNINDIIRVTCGIQAEEIQETTTMLSEMIKATSPPSLSSLSSLSSSLPLSSSSTSLCSNILKSIASFFFRRNVQPATVDSSVTSTESIVLIDMHTKLIPLANTNNNNNTNTYTHHKTNNTQTPTQPTQSISQIQHRIQHSTTIHSQSSLSLYFTTQPSSTFSFYSCSSCSSPFMPSACASSCCTSSCASTIAPLPFIVSPTTFINSSAGHFRPLCLYVNADDSRVYRRLLVQLEETERRFDDFWNTHLIRLKQCLNLRRFEQDFRELQVINKIK